MSIDDIQNLQMDPDNFKAILDFRRNISRELTGAGTVSVTANRNKAIMGTAAEHVAKNSEFYEAKNLRGQDGYKTAFTGAMKGFPMGDNVDGFWGC